MYVCWPSRHEAVDVPFTSTLLRRRNHVELIYVILHATHLMPEEGGKEREVGNFKFTQKT